MLDRNTTKQILHKYETQNPRQQNYLVATKQASETAVQAARRPADASGNIVIGKAGGGPSSNKASRQLLDASGNSGTDKAGKSNSGPSSNKASRRSST